jgi:signal transduction histidine kinase
MYTLAITVQLLLSYLIFRIRRFRNGFPFLFKQYAIIVALIAAGTVLLLVTRAQSLNEAEDVYVVYLYLTGTLITGVGIYIWIRRRIKMKYKLDMAERKIKQLEKELAEVSHKNKQLQEVNNGLLVAQHKITHRLAAMEASEEISIDIDDVKRLTADYHNDVDKIKRKKLLPSTGMDSLDTLFAYFSEKFAGESIGFNLEVSGSIPNMTEHIIPKGKLETMVGDHLQDALVAVKASDGNTRRILAFIGEVDGYYEFIIHDSGIPFEVDTLARLGTKRVTTHADTGGSGIGFMTTFETMRECKASLIIKENNPGDSGFSKSVSIRFDGMNQYIIETYRSGDFPPSDRYSVIDCK